ncbi:MAG: right-handed parallel beta-helix repeat-containing protein [Bacteroidia bacterium]|jgi:Right handed beta helix region/Secretion system C-terminal sorting domain
MNMFRFLFASLSFLLVSNTVIGKNTSFRIEISQLYLDGNNQEFKDIQPGDTLLIVAGSRDYLLIKNFKGKTDHPIVLINSGGEVIIDTDHYYGISIQNCRFIKLTGTGDIRENYGFQIRRVANGGGIGVGDLSSDFEIEHISIENCPIGGIYAKTDPDCTLTSVRGVFTQYNTSIHDNYIANVGNEGLYIGSSKYSGQTVSCNGKDTILLPSILDGVKVYNNIIKYSGWDGIQVSSASKNCRIYNNTILFDSQAEYENQMSGILIGGGSKCDCYNNFISQGKGNGIESHGLGGYRIFNNIIVDAGRSFLPKDLTKMKHGIFVTDVSTEENSSFYMEYNDIINPKSDGIRFSSIKSLNNVIASNAIINPGNFDFYENGNTSFKGSDSYIMLPYHETQVGFLNNFLSRKIADAGFSSTSTVSPEDFELKSGSPLIDAAFPDKSITFDFSGFPRPFGPKSDIGAYEYNVTNADFFRNNFPERHFQILENPVKNSLKIFSESGTDQKLTLNIYNLNGQLIRQFRNSALKMEPKIIQTDVSGILSGFYLYTIQTENGLSSGKFVKW